MYKQQIIINKCISGKKVIKQKYSKKPNCKHVWQGKNYNKANKLIIQQFLYEEMNSNTIEKHKWKKDMMNLFKKLLGYGFWQDIWMNYI